MPPRENRVGIRSGRRGGRHSLAEKFAARLVKSSDPDGCWEVQGCKSDRTGHVHLSEGSVAAGDYRRVYAHVFAWEQENGPVPPGLKVLHKCDNGRCARTSHLFLGTQRDNMLDAVNKGRKNCFGIQKLNAAQVQEIRALWASGKVLQKDIAQRFNIARNTVSGIVHNKSWQHLGPFDPVGAVFERVDHVDVPVRGDLHLGPTSSPIQPERPRQNLAGAQ